jgi:hypothetical protein
MPTQVYWPPALEQMWDKIFPCIDCRHDSALAGRLAWDQYVPLKTIGILPPGALSATYLVLAAEPAGALGMKDRERAIARQRPPNGVRNFNGTRGDLALQFALERWLLKDKNESYYVTDLAKCTVPTGSVATATGPSRYARCGQWFEQELTILQPRAVIAVGKSALAGARRQRRETWPPIFDISHWGAAGVSHWKKSLSRGWETGLPDLPELGRFARKRWPLSLHKRDIEAAIGRFPPSYRWLLAVYRRELGEIREALDAGATAGR